MPVTEEVRHQRRRELVKQLGLNEDELDTVVPRFRHVIDLRLFHIVGRHYGILSEAFSVEEISALFKIPKARMAREIKKGVAALLEAIQIEKSSPVRSDT